MVRHWIAALYLALVTSLGCGVAVAQEFPSKRITIIVGVAPGGTLDALARQIAQGIQPILKQPVVVENVTGAGGLVGMLAGYLVAGFLVMFFIERFFCFHHHDAPSPPPPPPPPTPGAGGPAK